VSGDLIRVLGVRATGHHGVFDFEKRDGQEFVVDVELSVDLARAGSSDVLTQTVHYGEVAADIVARIEGEPFDLIEKLAHVIARDCVSRPLVEAATVTVHKPQAPVGVPFGDVQVVVHRVRRAVPVVIALGANLGDPATTLDAAVAAVAGLDGLVVGRVSRYVETDPVGGPEQPAYANAVLVGLTTLAPHHLLRLLHEIEAAHGRTREIRWGARTLDLDLIQYGTPGEFSEALSEDADLLLPHPRAHERAFVLVPWLDADPDAVLRTPGGLSSVVDVLAGLGSTGVRPWRSGAGGSG
jgi:dihydroneopterin aldolase/2-amino-4-hydroxy-6-hydroxymethyldihydropteridine diphosphokinase